MAVATSPRGGGGTYHREDAPDRDTFVRLHHVLQIHHATAPNLDSVAMREGPETLDDCLVASNANIARYHLKPPFRWVHYQDLQATMAERRNSGRGNNTPYPAELVFSALKVALAEAIPVRATLVSEPCYPWQAKLATRVPGQRLWMVYAAVAVLNSRFGEAFYDVLLPQVALKSAKPHGLKIPVLRQIPIARIDWEYAELGKVADLTHQLTALHEGRQECLSVIREHASRRRYLRRLVPEYEGLFAQQIEAVNTRLEDALRQLLGLDEAEEHALLRTAVPAADATPPQTRLFEEWELLPPVPPPPPVRFLRDGNSASPDASLVPDSDTGGEGEIRRLLRFWEDVVNSRPPREFYEEAVIDRSAA